MRHADLVIWLDGAQYVRHSFVNRNYLSDGTRLTVPVDEHATFAPIHDVLIADPTGRARKKIAKTLEQRFGRLAGPFSEELRRPYPKLIGLNLALMGKLMASLGIKTEQRIQSFIDIEPPITVVSDDEEQVAKIRDRYADLAYRLGATVWLSGPGKHHGDVERFSARGIRIEYTSWEGPNPSAIELLTSRPYVAPQSIVTTG